ncbi:MAG TPA: response regulator transcription factor [Terriglobales bacterium]|nr:response regulator transcription factor [Terriglobales bacterium]
MVVRVLVVDDYQSWVRFIRSMLQDAREFQVLAEVSDGREAVQKAEQLQPDLILLDIGLPTLNGIEAARKIRAHNPQAKILFVSEQRSEEIAREALNTGSGYVVKSCAARDLFPAMKAVLEGRRFVSAVVNGSNFTQPKGEWSQSNGETAGSRHEVNCYPDKTTFVEGFARFVGIALKKGAVVVLASESHRVDILQRLKSEGVDVATAIEQNRYFPLDIPDGFHTFQFAEYLATNAVKAARERNLRVGVG